MDNFTVYSKRRTSIDFGGSLKKFIFLIPSQDLLRQNQQFQKLVENFQEIKLKDGSSMFAGICSEQYQPQDVLISMIAFQIYDQEKKEVCFTGGTVKPFISQAENILGKDFKIIQIVEYISLSYGLNCYLKDVKDPIYKFIENKKVYQNFEESQQCQKLLAILGTAIGFKIVQPDGQFQLVGGSPLGGGSLKALIETLTGVNNYKESIDLAIQGDRKSVDFTFGDTNDSQFANFPQDMVIYNFVKLSREKIENGTIPKADIIRSLYCFVIGQVGYTTMLTASLHKIKDIFVCGNLLNHQDFAIQQFQKCFGKNYIENYYYLTYAGHLTAIGVLLKSMA